jgi:hypothetical protein
MIKWLQRLFTLQAERDSALKRVDELEDELMDAEARLFTEIDGNRRRESELVNAVLAAAGADRTAGPHRQLAGEKDREPLEVDTPLEPKISEQEVDLIANQFIASAREGGIEYTPEAAEVLREMIRKDPEQYV